MGEVKFTGSQMSDSGFQMPDISKIISYWKLEVGQSEVEVKYFVLCIQ